MSFCRLFIAFILVAPATAVLSVDERDEPIKISTPVSIPTKLKLNNLGNPKGLIERDLARAKALLSKSTFGQTLVDVPLNNAGTYFTADVSVGTPPKTYELLVDTGSSNTFLSTRTHYTPTSSAVNTTHKVAVTYGSGKFEGYEFTETVAFGHTTITAQSIGISEKDQGLDQLDGLLGLGPDDLTRGTVEGVDIVPTVTDNLAKQGKIGAPVLGISFVPSTRSLGATGALDFGAPDTSKFTGGLTYVPITKTRPASLFWGFDQSVSYGKSKTEIMRSTAGILDTGTTLLLLPSDAFNAYINVTSAKLDGKTGLLRIDNPDSLQSLFFKIGGKTFEFTANAQIWPRVFNTDIGGDANATYLIIAGMSTPSGQGLDFINGFTFLQRFYSVYDTPRGRVGLATTSHTHDTSN